VLDDPVVPGAQQDKVAEHGGHAGGLTAELSQAAGASVVVAISALDDSDRHREERTLRRPRRPFRR
jgi:hypothetical protein